MTESAAATPHVVVLLPDALVRLFPGASRRVELSAGTIVEIVDALNDRWPGMRDRLCERPGRLRRHINVFVDGKRMTDDAVFAPGAEIIIMMALRGG